MNFNRKNQNNTFNTVISSSLNKDQFINSDYIFHNSVNFIDEKGIII